MSKLASIKSPAGPSLNQSHKGLADAQTNSHEGMDRAVVASQVSRADGLSEPRPPHPGLRERKRACANRAWKFISKEIRQELEKAVYTYNSHNTQL